jgi:hypothetical protein
MVFTEPVSISLASDASRLGFSLNSINTSGVKIVELGYQYCTVMAVSFSYVKYCFKKENILHYSLVALCSKHMSQLDISP